MENKQLIELIDKYLAGNCTPAEAIIVEQWYESQQPVQSESYPGSEEEVRVAAVLSISSIRAKLGLQQNLQEPVKIKSSPAWWRNLAAACILLLLSIGAFTWFSRKPAETFTVIRSATGQVKTINLPDGTRVSLNAGTTLKYASDFNRKDRQVWLDGEAFFDVVHDQDKPFDVHTGQLKTHVLGTAFSVSSYPKALVSTVTVIRGKVQVSDNKAVLGYLLPNKKLEYASEEGTGKIIDVNAGKVISWKSGTLAFIDMPMQDIAIHLQQWYGVNFVFNNQKLRKIRFTASFNNHISLKSLLEVMYDAYHVTYKVDEQSKTITYL